MNCFMHQQRPAVGACVICQKGMCADCVGRESPRLVCRSCLERGSTIGFEYRSAAAVGSWPLLHICTGADAVTMRPKVAKGVIAIGNIAIGGLAVGGLAVGLIGVGGVSLGILCALGGAAFGLGLSLGGLAVGSVAFGGLAIGYSVAIGGGALGPAVIDGRSCDQAARDFVLKWLGSSGLPPSCR